MAELTCRVCGNPAPARGVMCTYGSHYTDDEPRSAPTPPVDEQPRAVPDRADESGVEVVVGDARVRVEIDDTVILGRQAEDPIGTACSAFGTVSRTHASVRARAGGVVEVRDLGSVNGTFLAGQRITGSEARTVPLPVAVRLARHCFVHLRVARD